jgi:hypothetical protein
LSLPERDRPTDAFVQQLLEAGELEDAALPPGSKVGRYVVLEQVGVGGMSVVYSAYDPQLDRAVALKVMRPRPSGEGTRRDAGDRLLREAQALAKLSHPNIIAVHDCGRLGDEVFVAMEFVPGLTLAQWSGEHPRDVDEVLSVFIQAGRGLAAAHQAGLIHRDFKPTNVIVGQDGRVRVVDFGLALAARAGPDRPQEPARADEVRAGGPLGVTSVGSLLGTPAYMAPEQHRRQAVDARTDQFGFCVALYEALYGEPPFAGTTVDELAAAVTAGQIRPEPSRSSVPGWIRPILRRGLAADREQRYLAMDDLLAALSRGPRAGRRGWVAAAAIAAVALAGAGVWLATRGPATPCPKRAEELAQVWNEPTKRAVKEAFLASRRPGAGQLFGRVARVLDGYAAAWQTMRAELCRASGSAQSLALRRRCLDQRRREFSALVGRFAVADPQTVDEAVHAAFELTGVAACADEAALAMNEAQKRARAAVDEQTCSVPVGGRYNPLEVGRVWVYDVIDKSTRRPAGDPKVVAVEAFEEIGGCKGDTRAFRLRRDTSRGYGYRWQEARVVDSPGHDPPGLVTIRHRDTWFTADGRVTKDEYYVPGRIRLDETCRGARVGSGYLDSYDEVEVDTLTECGEEIAREPRVFDWRVVADNVVLTQQLDYSHPRCCPGGQRGCSPPPNGPGHRCTPVAGSDTLFTCQFKTLQVERMEVDGGTDAIYWFAVDVGKVLEDSKGNEREELICFAKPPRSR